MNIDLKQLRKQIGHKICVAGSLELDPTLLTDRTPLSPLSYDIEYELFDDKLFFSGKGEIKYGGNCYRCGKSIDIKESVKFKDVVSFEDNDYDILNEKFPLKKFLEDKVVLSQNPVLLCSQGCKGLCPVCGKDKNIASCKCESAQEKENPFYALKKSINDDKLK